MVAALSATMLLLPFVTRWKYFVFQGVCFPNELPEAVQELRKAQLLCAAISLIITVKRAIQTSATIKTVELAV